MSKLAHSNQDTMDEIEMRNLFQQTEPDSQRISHDEAFEILDAAGIKEIAWSDTLNAEFAQWLYLNIK